MQILNHHHRRRASIQLVHQRTRHLVWLAAGFDLLAQLPFDRPSDVKQRPQRPRREQRIARRPQHPHRPASLATEPAHQRSFADPRLAMYQHHQPDATLSNLAKRSAQRPKLLLALEQLRRLDLRHTPRYAHIHIILTALHERNRRPEPITRPRPALFPRHRLSPRPAGAPAGCA